MHRTVDEFKIQTADASKKEVQTRVLQVMTPHHSGLLATLRDVYLNLILIKIGGVILNILLYFFSSFSSGTNTKYNLININPFVKII
jgi:hypothetical protein